MARARRPPDNARARRRVRWMSHAPLRTRRPAAPRLDACWLPPCDARRTFACPALPRARAPRASTRHRATGPSALSSPARSATAAPAACEPLAGAAPEVLPVLRSGEGLNYAGLDLDRARDGTIEVCVLVDSTGTVSEARVVRPFPPFDSAAFEAARWWVFAPARDHGRPGPARRS